MLVFIVSVTQPPFNLRRGSSDRGISQIRLACGHVCKRLSFWVVEVAVPSPLWAALFLGRRACRRKLAEAVCFLGSVCFCFLTRSHETLCLAMEDSLCFVCQFMLMKICLWTSEFWLHVKIRGTPYLARCYPSFMSYR